MAEMTAPVIAAHAVAGAAASPPVAVRASRQLAIGWLWVAVYCLVAAGLMAVLLAFSRTPFIQDLIDNPDLFKVALVVHVDLSAVIWFLACAGVLWSVLAPGRPTGMDRTALGLMVLGTLMITVAPFVGVAKPLMNNYVPVLRHPWFFIGLVAAVAGVAIQGARFLWSSRGKGGSAREPLEAFAIGRSLLRTRIAIGRSLPRRRIAIGRSLLRGFAARSRRERTSVRAVLTLAMQLAALVFLVALASIGLSLWRMPAAVDGELYFELLFWGGGHVLQFAYTLMLLGAWLALTIAAGAASAMRPATLRMLFALVVAPLVVVPWLYTSPLDQPRHLDGFTELMRWGGLACLPLGLVAVKGVLVGIERDIEARLLHRSALWSMVLFAAGGVLGFLIDGSNTMVPAHYHGSVVAVTLALMGLIYYALPRLGHPITLPRTASWQPAVYAVGQLMHVTGLAWCGGYGVQRKVAGAAQGLDGLGETAGMALMGAGGAVSVVGGVMFLVVVIRALTQSFALGRAPLHVLAGTRRAAAPIS